MIEITYAIAMAAGRDAGNRSMFSNDRTQWNADDWNAAVETTNALLRHVADVETLAQHYKGTRKLKL